MNGAGMSLTFEECARELVDAGRFLYEQGMVPATSGNFSARMDTARIAITESGKHKGRLAIADIMQVDNEGRSLDGRRPSAETALHMQIYKHIKDAMVVLHHHSAYATLLSQMVPGSFLKLSDYEVLKVFPDIDTHESSVIVPVFDNCQDIPLLAGRVEEYMSCNSPVHGYLIRGHGLYTWGETFPAALNHVEAFEFLFKCEIMKKGVNPL